MGMNEFQNKLLLKDEAYQCGLFPQIPNFRKDGSAFILTDGCNDDLRITERTTSKEIRQGRYTRLVEISTRPYMTEIQFNANAQEQAYSFDVYVKAVVQVVDPITFYRNRNIDVDAYFNKLFSIDVKQITRQYSILNYGGLDRELTRKLSAYNNVDSDTGFSYQVSMSRHISPGHIINKCEIVENGRPRLVATFSRSVHTAANQFMGGNYLCGYQTVGFALLT